MYSAHTYPDGTVLHTWELNQSSAELAAQCREAGLPDQCEARAEQRRRELLGERLLLHHIFGREMRMDHNADREPLIEGYTGHLSVAHTRGLLMIALNGDHPIGIDVETYERRVTRVRDYYLSQGERQWIPADDMLRHLIAWTAKEAIFKAIGVRANVQNYRDQIICLPFEPPAVGSSLRHQGRFKERDFYLETHRGSEFLTTFTCPSSKIPQI